MHNKPLDGLRGWAAVAVILYHAILHFDPSSWQRLVIAPVSTFDGLRNWITGAALMVFNGDTAVTIFFVISGLVLHASLYRMRDVQAWRVIVGFIVKRVLRIYPALIVCTIATFFTAKAIHAVGRTSFTLQFSAKEMVENSLLLSNSILGVSWTLAVEIAAIPLLLLLHFGWRRFGYSAGAAAVIYSMLAVQNPSLLANVPYIQVASLAFVLGAWLATPASARLFEHVSPSAVILALIAAIVAGHVNEGLDASSVIARSLGAALLVGSIRYANSGRLIRFLSAPLSQMLGRLSYSLYLVNVPVSYVFFAFLPYVFPENALPAGIVSGVAITLISVPLALLSHRFVESPTIALSSRLARRFIGTASDRKVAQPS